MLNENGRCGYFWDAYFTCCSYALRAASSNCKWCWHQMCQVHRWLWNNEISWVQGASRHLPLRSLQSESASRRSPHPATYVHKHIIEGVEWHREWNNGQWLRLCYRREVLFNHGNHLCSYWWVHTIIGYKRRGDLENETTVMLPSWSVCPPWCTPPLQKPQ